MIENICKEVGPSMFPKEFKIDVLMESWFSRECKKVQDAILTDEGCTTHDHDETTTHAAKEYQSREINDCINMDRRASTDGFSNHYGETTDVSQALLRHLLMGVIMGYLLMSSQVLQRYLLKDVMVDRYLLMGAKERHLLMDFHSSILVT